MKDQNTPEDTIGSDEAAIAIEGDVGEKARSDVEHHVGIPQHEARQSPKYYI